MNGGQISHLQISPFLCRLFLLQWFTCTDLGKDLKPIIDRFHSSEEYKKGFRDSDSIPLPEPEVDIDTCTDIEPPFELDAWLSDKQTELTECSHGPFNITRINLFPGRSKNEFVINVVFGPCFPKESLAKSSFPSNKVEEESLAHDELTTSKSQVFIMFVRGHGRLEVVEDNRCIQKCMMKDDVILIPKDVAEVGYRLQMSRFSAAIEMRINPPIINP